MSTSWHLLQIGREAVRYDDCLWKEMCCSKFNMPRHASLGDPGVSWRDLYRWALPFALQLRSELSSVHAVLCGASQSCCRLYCSQCG